MAPQRLLILPHWHALGPAITIIVLYRLKLFCFSPQSPMQQALVARGSTSYIIPLKGGLGLQFPIWCEAKILTRGVGAFFRFPIG